MKKEYFEMKPKNYVLAKQTKKFHHLGHSKVFQYVSSKDLYQRQSLRKKSIVCWEPYC
jgi:hypothetical protein